MVLYKDLNEMNRMMKVKPAKKNKLWKEGFNEVDKNLVKEEHKNKKLTEIIKDLEK